MRQILLIDDHEVVRIGLKHIIGDAVPVAHWAETGDAQEALQIVERQHLDLIILELALNGNRGLELLKELKRVRPNIPVLVITIRSERQYALRAIRAGAAGFVTKANGSAELQMAAKRVLQGGRYISASFAETLTADLRRQGPEAIHELLSDREYQVLRLIGTGKTVREIAALLNISDKTVSTYRARILDKTGLKNNAEVVRYVVESGLTD